jgi:hypothetical protein
VGIKKGTKPPSNVCVFGISNLGDKRKPMQHIQRLILEKQIGPKLPHCEDKKMNSSYLNNRF